MAIRGDDRSDSRMAGFSAAMIRIGPEGMLLSALTDGTSPSSSVAATPLGLNGELRSSSRRERLVGDRENSPGVGTVPPSDEAGIADV